MIIDLAAIADHHRDAVGAKALGLGRMIRAGLPVPPGFCLVRDAWREHLHSHGLRARIEAALRDLDGADPDRRSAVLHDLREAITSAPIPDEPRAAVRWGYERLAGGKTAAGVAVRSSATVEDCPDHSFAGQHDTFLSVRTLPDCLDAIRRCWASVWTERAFEYRTRCGIDHVDIDMAVIVQEMTAADVSGVVFTADPISGQRERIVIEGSFGLGEAIVSGKVSPDRIVISRPGLVIRERVTGTKSLEIVPDPAGGVRERGLPAARRRALCLEDDSARRLGGLAVEAERAFGFPLDIEWALRDGEPYLLQARPITIVPEETPPEDRQVWTNANAGEVLPDVATPMTWSFVEPLATRLLALSFARLGMRPEGHVLIGLQAGRAYFNLNSMIAFTRRVPGMKGKSIAELFGGTQDAEAALGKISFSEEDIPDVGFSIRKALLGLPGMVHQFLFLSRERAGRALSRARRMSAELEAWDLQTASDEELAGRVKTALDDLRTTREVYELIGVAVGYETGLYDLCRRWLGDSGNAYASRLLAGLGNNENADAGLDLWKLAAAAHESPVVEEAIIRGTGISEVRRVIGGAPEGDAFLAAWDAFVRDHGHHCRGELELMNPRWSEEPDRILDQVRSYLDAIGREDFLARYERVSRERAAAAARCRRRLRNPLKRLVFDFLLWKAQRYSPLRENLKSRIVRWLAAMRRVLLELGARMARRGLLRDREDIFFLRIDELGPILRRAGDLDASEMVQRRRAEYTRNLSMRPPAIIVGRFDPDRHVPETVDGSARTLRGVAVNPGVVTGRARVILRAGTDRVLPSEILVAPFTDPGWTPYFLNAAAIVMDLGGLLSHGSIIAREYGIPAVANVGPATEVIRTGQSLRVDGARGVVEILD